MRRRELLRTCILSAGSVLGAPMLNFGRCRLHAGTERRYSVRTIDLVNDSLVVDMLGLLTMDWNRLHAWHTDPYSLDRNDLALLKESGVNVFHPAMDFATPDPYSHTRRLLDHWAGLAAAHPNHLQIVNTCDDLRSVKASGRIGILLGTQNSDHFRSAGDVALFHRLGQRISQLTYNAANRIGGGCIDSHDPGLTEFGHSIVTAMNDARMMIDVSHAGERTTLDTFNASRHPVLVTHSNCKALSKHPRCKSDEVIRAMARSGGVMGITCIRNFVRQSDRVTIHDALDHFDHVVRLVGPEHVGLGSDMDLEGRPRYVIRGLDHPRRVFDITEGLLRRKYSSASIRQILGGNFRRVISGIC